MADGKDIHESSSEYPYEARPYDNTCVTSGDLVLSKNYVLKDKTYKAYANREPRFYVNIGYSHALWTMESTTEGSKKNIVVDYFNGANSGKNNWYGRTSYFLTGYMEDEPPQEGNQTAAQDGCRMGRHAAGQGRQKPSC